MSNTIVPYSLKDAPALIERLLPVQKLSVEAYKEQMAVHGKTLTALGSYWKGRKPLILNKSCILGCLLPISDDPIRDLEIFEMLMGMDRKSLELRLEEKKDKLSRFILNEQSTVGYDAPYRDWIKAACRPEECGDELFTNIWEKVNDHLGTDAHSFPELVEQLGIMRFGQRPRMADTFCGSGQIPFEAARLGCDVYASDLNPIACMLTWGAFNIVGGSKDYRQRLINNQKELISKVRKKIDEMGIEKDGNGWEAKVYLYCVEVRCPQTGWMVPLLPTLVISNSRKTIAKLIPDSINHRYDIQVINGVSDSELEAAKIGTIGRDGKYGEAFLIHKLSGITYKNKISTLRGDYKNSDGTTGNNLRIWEKHDFKPQPDDIFQERLYCVQWIRPIKNSKRFEFEFRSVTFQDLEREQIVENFISEKIIKWQDVGWLPDMRIEVGGPPRYQGLDLIKARGWSYWHHVFNPRQLLLAGIINQLSNSQLSFAFMQTINNNSRLSRWKNSSDQTVGAFDNQAINTLYNYGCRGLKFSENFLAQKYKLFPFSNKIKTSVNNIQPINLSINNDIFITDPPYGDAVKYEEILDFFIAWIRKNPPPEFSDWIWDSRRALAIKGEDEDFRQGMVAAYKRMTECMPDNGIQVIMFTHQSGTIWADMANIVWASGLQVTAAWYVVTETDSALRAGSHVKGTVLLVCRKRMGTEKTTRDDLGWEIQEEVEEQIRSLTGLNQQAKGLYRDENVFEDADIQMAGYAAALRVLTRYAMIDGRDMTAEAIRPRIKGETTFVDELITFAVDTANRCLVPEGIPDAHWERLSGAERFYLKMIDLESRGAKTLDNYQNFAKAFKVRDFHAFMASSKANNARLKTALEFGRSEMSQGSELHESTLRAVLYALMELARNIDGNEVLTHLAMNIPDYYGDITQREIATELADYLADRLEALRPEEASTARVLRELIKNQRLG